MAEEPFFLTITATDYTADPRLQPDGSIKIATLAPGTRISDFIPGIGGWLVRQPGNDPELLTYDGLQPLPATVTKVVGECTIRAATSADRARYPGTSDDPQG